MGKPIPGTSFRVGDPIGDKWIVLDLLGKGGMSVVYLAQERNGSDLVALKTMREDVPVTQAIRDRFHEEARIWFNIGSHPHILKARDVQRLNSSIFISMDYVPPNEPMQGSSLRDWMWFCRLEHKQILKWAVQFCYGMEHAQKHGLKCHGDINPRNILIDTNEDVKISDFGLSLSLECENTSLCGSGTPQYMAPEQFHARGDVDVQSDIYSFGNVLFEMVTGHAPFTLSHTCVREAETDEALRQAFWEVHNNQDIPEANSPLDPVIKKCMAKKKGDRFQDFTELRHALLKLCAQFNTKVEEPVLSPPSLQELNLKGSQLLSLGLFSEAISYFDRVLITDPNDCSALNGKGKCLVGLERYEEAQEYFSRLLREDHRDISALIGKGSCLQRLKRHDEASAWFDIALDMAPREHEAWVKKARNCIVLDLPDKAVQSYRTALDLLIGHKRKEEAIAVAEEALGHFPQDERINQLYGWTLRLRDEEEQELDKSIQILQRISDCSSHDPETTGLLAGSYKRVWASNPEAYGVMLEKALDIYKDAWEQSNRKNSYVGINTATLSLLLGRPEASREIAVEIKESFVRLDSRLQSYSGTRFSSYWDRVTLAEAELLLGNLGKARRLYQDVMALYKEKRTYLDSSIAQINLILPRLGLSINAFDFLDIQTARLGSNRVCLGITGHQRLKSPRVIEDQLKKALTHVRNEFEDNMTFEILSPLAEGTDRLAARVVLGERESILRAPIPLEVEDYITDFGGTGTESGKEFQSYLNRAEEVIVLPSAKNRRVAYENVGRYVAEHCDILIAIWDGNDPNGLGGTAEVVSYARNKGVPLIWIHAAPPHEITYERLDRINSTMLFKGGSYMDKYEPKPIDTSRVELSDELIELTETLAENNHEIWAKRRFAEGWTHGPRNDDAKTNPDLVPYDDLAASEKEYDRDTVLETIKALISLGYRIEKE